MKRQRSYAHNIPAARHLRSHATVTEQILWEQLRDRRLAGLKFRRQHAIGPYVVDFYCSSLSLAVEIDGPSTHALHSGTANGRKSSRKTAFDFFA